MLERVWRQGNPPTLLVGMRSHYGTVWRFLRKLRIAIWSSNPSLGLYPEKTGNSKRYMQTYVWASQVAQWYRIHLQCRKCRFNPWVRKIPWRRKWQPTPVFLPGKSGGQKSLVGYRLWGLKELYMTEHTCTPLPSSKSLWGLTVAMKLKDTCSSERKLWQT